MDSPAGMDGSGRTTEHLSRIPLFIRGLSNDSGLSAAIESDSVSPRLCVKLLSRGGAGSFRLLHYPYPCNKLMGIEQTEDSGQANSDRTTKDELFAIEPSDAAQLFYDSRRKEVAEMTLKKNQTNLRHFLQWCSEEDIDDCREINGRTIHRFRIHQKAKDNAISTFIRLMVDIRMFVRFLESIEAVKPGVSERIDIPDSPEQRQSRDELISVEQIEAVLDYLAKYHYASEHHVTLLLLWETGMRVGTLISLDVDDFDEHQQTIHPQHRPESGTPLKNGISGERVISLLGETPSVVAEYITHHRTQPESKDTEHQRKPLFTTVQGRRSKSTVQKNVYRWCRPCLVGECPIGEDPDTCEYNQTRDPPKCPETVGPHTLRRSQLTHLRANDVPVEVVTDRCDVSQKVLSEHYDKRTEQDKAEQRRKFLEDTMG